jgi:hypothetical protein
LICPPADLNIDTVMNKEVHITDNELHDLIQPTCQEVHKEDNQYGLSRPTDEEKPYGGWEGHWAGDGSGMDDFADYNQNEGWGNW